MATFLLILLRQDESTQPPQQESHGDHAITVSAICTFYGHEFHGKQMADGSVFDMNDPSIVALGDRDIPLGTKMMIYNLETGRSLEVVVRDRMNSRYHGLDTMRLDLSRAGAEALGIVERGRVYLTVEFVPPEKWTARREDIAN